MITKQVESQADKNANQAKQQQKNVKRCKSKGQFQIHMVQPPIEARQLFLNMDTLPHREPKAGSGVIQNMKAVR